MTEHHLDWNRWLQAGADIFILLLRVPRLDAPDPLAKATVLRIDRDEQGPKWCAQVTINDGKQGEVSYQFPVLGARKSWAEATNASQHVHFQISRALLHGFNTEESEDVDETFSLDIGIKLRRI